MSLLASEGIGAFDKKHFVLDLHGGCSLVAASGTHTFVWEALDYWASQPKASDLVLDVVVAGGQRLRAWVDLFSSTGTVATILARNWLKQWGLDLLRMTEDRNSRNVASYRPTAFTSPRPDVVEDSVDFVRQLWLMCEPTLSSKFRWLDVYLLRSSLCALFGSTHSFTHRDPTGRNLYKMAVDSTIAGLSPQDWTPKQWRAFLTERKLRRLPRILKEASGTLEPADRGHEKQVISRATLLLRIATGACEQMLKSVPAFTPSQLDFWRVAVGEDRCLWAPGIAPSTPDLWTDIQVALNDLEVWRTGNASNRCYASLWTDQAAPAIAMGSCERICLWGLGL
jgi:hypothetical protein